MTIWEVCGEVFSVYKYFSMQRIEAEGSDSLMRGSENFPIEDRSEHKDFTLEKEGLVSFQAELPAPLQKAMVSFIEKYPNWDQYRLIQAALAGFLVQNGIESRCITRLYIGNMFGSESLINGSKQTV